MQNGIGLAGIILVFAGLHLMWRARHEIVYWADMYLAIFQKSLRRMMEGESAPLGGASSLPKTPREPRKLLLLLGGVGLVIIGQVLFLLDLAF